MKIIAILCSAVIPLLVSCASPPIELAAVGPNPSRIGATSIGQGDLIVFSETEDYYEDNSFYHPHTDYLVYSTDGRLLKRVSNHQGHEDESPAIVTLKPGQYIVKARAEFFGQTSIPVVIEPNRTTKVILQPGWDPGKAVAGTQLVRMPAGYAVGWSAQHLSGQ